jgi:uridine kinase
MTGSKRRSEFVATLTAQRMQILDAVAGLIPERPGSDCILVGVDGVDGSGKTVFADELSEVIRRSGRPTVRVSVDDFHNVSALRYRRGRDSPEGFWLDSFNYARLRSDVLVPLGPGGSRRYRQRGHDLASDQELRPEPQVAPASSVVVIDGLFLHRHELADVWDFTIFLDVAFAVTVPRMAARDGSHPDPTHPTLRRYVQAQAIYLGECDPKNKASIVIDNTRFDDPRIVFPQSHASVTKGR